MDQLSAKNLLSTTKHALVGEVTKTEGNEEYVAFILLTFNLSKFADNYFDFYNWYFL